MFLEIIQEATIDCYHTISKIALIVIPLMIFLRWTRESKILDKATNYLQNFTQKIYLSKEAAFPLLVGLFFGISYGAGVIIQATKEGNLTKEDSYLINVFLAICHSVVEDTFIFLALGASVGIILGLRITLAIIVTYLVGRFILKLDIKAANNKLLKENS